MKRCCPVSDLAGTPVAVTHIKIGSREGAAVIDVVGGPAKCDVRAVRVLPVPDTLN